jgi:hypothetical protein
MLRHKTKFIGLPVAVMAVALAIGSLTSWPNDVHLTANGNGIVAPPTSMAPLAMLVNTWFAWNVWHFARQNFGVLSLYRRRAGIVGRRWLDQGFAFAVMVPGMLLMYVISVAAHLWPDSARDVAAAMVYSYLARAHGRSIFGQVFERNVNKPIQAA